MDHIWALRVTRLSQSASGQRNYPAPPSRWEVFRYDKPKAGQRAQHSHGLVPRPQRPRPDNSPKIGWSVAAKISLASGILWWLVKWVVAAILAGAGIWGGVTWAIILRETEWRWIAMAIAVEAVILAAAIHSQTPAEDAGRRRSSPCHDSHGGRVSTPAHVVVWI
jgi:hypothetical protein